MMLSIKSSNYLIPYMNSPYKKSIQSQLLQLSIDIFVFLMAKLSALKIYH